MTPAGDHKNTPGGAGNDAGNSTHTYTPYPPDTAIPAAIYTAGLDGLVDYNPTTHTAAFDGGTLGDESVNDLEGELAKLGYHITGDHTDSGRRTLTIAPANPPGGPTTGRTTIANTIRAAAEQAHHLTQPRPPAGSVLAHLEKTLTALTSTPPATDTAINELWQALRLLGHNPDHQTATR